jgi:hypothetical protein
MKNLSNLKGAKALNKIEQKSVNGGKASKPLSGHGGSCHSDSECEGGLICAGCICLYPGDGV